MGSGADGGDDDEENDGGQSPVYALMGRVAELNMSWLLF